jgi:hypothetical protein
MGTVNTINPKLDQTVRIFDQFYDYEQYVPVNEYDAVYSFFASVFKTKEAAANFASSLFRVADQTNVSVVTLLESMQNKDQVTVTATMAYYLNGLRSNSTLLGVNSVLTPNYYTARNVLP